MKSIYEFLQYIEIEYCKKTAFKWYDTHECKVVKRSYSEFVSDIYKFCSFLKGQFSNTEGKHIAIVGENSYQYAVAFLGCLAANAVAVPMNTRESIESVCSALDAADTDLILTDLGSFALPNVYQKPVFGLDAYCDYPPTDSAMLTEDLRTLGVLMKTSGTTAHNRFTMLSHGNILNGIDCMQILFDSAVEEMGFTPQRALHIMPMNHIAGIMSMLTWCRIGVTVCLCSDIRNMKRDNDLFLCDYVFAVPIMLQIWSKAMMKGNESHISSIKGIICGGASIDMACMKFFVERNIAVIFGYGLTESTCVGVYNPIGRTRKFSSVGKPRDGIEVKLDNGEICFKGPSIMLGYYKDVYGTLDVIQDGWLHTGDLGYFDEDGFLYIIGRKKNLIILSNGENVSPEELEALLLKNENIREVLVKEKNGRICAEIFCDVQRQDEIEAYINQVNKSLPYYKHIVLTEYRTEPFEKTISGKIKR